MAVGDGTHGVSRPVLLTGFEPFGGAATNASWQAVSLCARLWDGPARLVTRELPVSFGVGGVLGGLLDELDPAAVVCVGEAADRTAVGVERVAVNVIDARIPDNDGAQPVDVPVADVGPVGYLTTLPVRACLAAMAEAGVPAEVSNTAGSYVCNAAFYSLMHLLTGRGPVPPAGFVHLPLASVMPTEVAAAGLLAVLGQLCAD